MEFITFNLDLREKPKNKREFQPVGAHSIAKNAFLIMAEFETKKIRPGYIKIESVKFTLDYLNNDIKYVVIKDAEFIKEDNKGFPSFKLCLRVENNPMFDSFTITTNNGPNHEIKTNNGILRIHIDFSENCSNAPITVGDWPCFTNKTL